MTSPKELGGSGAGHNPEELFALGYAGWAPGQLDAEMQQHGWYAAAGHPDIVFDTPVTARWKAAWQAEGVDVVFECSGSPHAWKTIMDLPRPGGPQR